jgi:hypothetical protein
LCNVEKGKGATGGVKLVGEGMGKEKGEGVNMKERI